MRRTHGSAVAMQFESLEPRTLMTSAPIASVGMAFETHASSIPVTVFSTEGFIDLGTGAATGSTYAAGEFDRFRTGGLLYTSVESLDSGRFLRHPARGTQGSARESNGARFLTRDGFDAGWWFADFGGGEKEVEWTIERPTDALRSDFQGTWRFSLIGVHTDHDDYYNGFGDVVIDAFSVRWYVDFGDSPRFTSSISGVNASGLMTTTGDEYLYINKDKSVIVFADMANDDGELCIGVAVREQSLTQNQVAGDYLLAWAFADRASDGGPNGQVDFRQRYVRLESDGDYRIWNLDDYDSGRTGSAYVINRGTWHVSGAEVVLEEQHSGDTIRFVASDNLSTLVGVLLQDAHADDPVLGLATRAFPLGQLPEHPDPVIAVPSSDASGRPLVFALGTDNVWEVVDLIGEAGGPNITGDVVSWIDPKDGHAYAAGMSSSGLVLYTQPTRGDWTYRVLTAETNGESITRGLSVMISADNLVNIVGLSASGKLLRYYQRGVDQRLTNGAFIWDFLNVELSDLRPAGRSTPAFVGSLISYATSWGGLNVAGLDASGRIWSVWWAPGQSRWTVTDLSAASGARAISGNLAVYLTPWNGINLAGLDDSGELRVTWWVPGFAGEWRQTNLTTETGGPHFREGSVTSYVSSWGGLNVAGIDDATGDVLVYWWVPERTNVGWAVTSLTDSITQGDDRIAHDSIMGLAGGDASLNIFGYGADGSFICYYWKPGYGAAWGSENLTLTAVDR